MKFIINNITPIDYSAFSYRKSYKGLKELDEKILSTARVIQNVNLSLRNATLTYIVYDINRSVEYLYLNEEFRSTATGGWLINAYRHNDNFYANVSLDPETILYCLTETEG